MLRRYTHLTRARMPRWMSVRAVVLLLVSASLVACEAMGARPAPNTELLDNMQVILDEAEATHAAAQVVTPSAEQLQALVPGMSLSDELLTPVSGRFNVIANRENASDFFNNLVAGTDYGVAVSPEVEGEISINLPNVTIDDVMNAMQETYGYQIRRQGNIYQIQPPGLQTRIFSIDYLNVSRSGNSTVSVTSGNSGSSGGGTGGGIGGGVGGAGISAGGFGGGGFGGGAGGGFGGAAGGLGGGVSGGGGGGGGGGGQISTQTETDFWSDIKTTLEGMIGISTSSDNNSNAGGIAGSGLLAGLGGGTTASASRSDNGRSVVVQPQVGLLMVTASPDELERVQAYINRAQDILSREVTIQVQFLEVILNKGYQSAIDFDTFGPGGADGTDNTVTAEFGADGGSLIDSISNPVSIATNFTDFSAVFRILESRGTTQVLSSPSLKVMNNQKAVFQDGDQEYFQTGVGSNVTSTGSTVTESSQNDIQPFFSGISMDITPQISADGVITLHVHPTITTVSEQTKSIADQQVPLARTSTRELDSVIRAYDGRIIILGGLAYERSIDDAAGLPVASDIPMIGGAFDQRRRSTVKSEFIILLRPVIANAQSEQRLIQDRSERLRNINQELNPF